MKKTLALALAALAMAGALAGCGLRDRPGRGDTTNPTQQAPAPADDQTGSATVPGPADLAPVESDLTSVDSLLNGITDDLAAADTAPEDAD